MKMILILHNQHDEASRKLVSDESSTPYIQWYEPRTEEEEAQFQQYTVQEMPLPSSFPSVVDTEVKKIAGNVTSLSEAVATIQEWASGELSRKQKAKRAIRDSLLSDCDWVLFVDSAASADCKAAFVAYRQSLRDIDFTDPEAIAWPTKPEHIKA
jgi:hypothetical protein